MGKGLTILLRLGGIFLGVVIIGIGYLIGSSSHQVTFQQISDTYIDHYISGDDSNNYTSYFDVEGVTSLFIVHESDFSPRVGATALGDGHISLVYNPDDETDVDITSNKGTHFKGKGYNVIALTALDAPPQSFTTSTYSQHPNGFQQNNWPFGYIGIGFGILLCALSLFFGEHILRALGYMLAGIVIGPLLFFLYIGFFVGGDAFKTDIGIAVVTGVIGGLIGLIYGIYKGVEGRAEAQRNKPILQREAAEKKQNNQEATAARARLATLPPPANSDDWNARAGLLMKAGRTSEALAALDRASTLAPTSGEAAWVLPFNRALLLYNEHHNEESLALCDQALRQQPAFMPAIRLRGDVLSALARYSEAIEMYDRALVANPTDVQMLNNKSVALARLGRIREGRQVCEQVLKLDPTNPVANKNIAAFRS